MIGIGVLDHRHPDDDRHIGVAGPRAVAAAVQRDRIDLVAECALSRNHPWDVAVEDVLLRAVDGILVLLTRTR